MLNIEEVKNTIAELENSTTTFENCQKLASLYIVRQNYENVNQVGNINESTVIKEYDDILPKYREYIDIKTQFQLGNISADVVRKAIKGVCKEVFEFVNTLCSCTDMVEERDCIKGLIMDLSNFRK